MGLVKISDKFKATSTIITAVCAIGSVLWIIFKEVNSYNNQKIEVQLNKENIDKFRNQVDSLIVENNILKTEIFSLKLHLEPVIDILNNQLYDYIYHGVRYKQTQDGRYFYYYNNGFFYNITYDQNVGQYYYTAEDGKTYWCK